MVFAVRGGGALSVFDTVAIDVDNVPLPPKGTMDMSLRIVETRQVLFLTLAASLRRFAFLCMYVHKIDLNIYVVRHMLIAHATPGSSLSRLSAHCFYYGAPMVLVVRLAEGQVLGAMIPK